MSLWDVFAVIGVALGVLWGIFLDGRLRCRCGARADGGWIDDQPLCQECFEHAVIYGVQK